MEIQRIMMKRSCCVHTGYLIVVLVILTSRLKQSGPISATFIRILEYLQ